MTTSFSKPTASTTALARRAASLVVVCIFQFPKMYLFREFVVFILVILQLSPFHPRRVFATPRGPIAPGTMPQGLLRRFHVGLFAPPNLQSRLLNGARK